MTCTFDGRGARRVRRRIADALWAVDAEQGRALFREAWDAAVKGDRESEGQPRLRREVLSLAAGRDRALAEEFLQKLRAEEEGRQDGRENAGADPWALSEAAEKRLGLAKDLLDRGDVEHALQFADPVLGGVTISTVEFLTQLREKDPAAADRRYAAMLETARANPLADANTVLLLSSYIFTPHAYVLFNTAGGASSAIMRVSSPPVNIAPQQRLAFFQTAGSILLRPLPPAGQDRGGCGAACEYMALKRVLPLFEQHAPADLTQTLRAAFESLGSQLNEGVRAGDDESVQRGVAPERPFADREASLLDETERARTSGERDPLYFRLALLALEEDGAKARGYVDKIDSLPFRTRVRAWVDWRLAVMAVEKKRPDAALEIADRGELTHVQRVWVFTQSAKLLAKSDRDKALSLLDAARAEVRLLDHADPNRARGLLAVAVALRLVDGSRVPDALSDAVEAANSSEGFTGEDGMINTTVSGGGRILMRSDPVPDFDVRGIFGELAKTDPERAALLAGGFRGEAPRANALIAVARALLDERPTADAP